MISSFSLSGAHSAQAAIHVNAFAGHLTSIGNSIPSEYELKVTVYCSYEGSWLPIVSQPKSCGSASSIANLRNLSPNHYEFTVPALDFTPDSTGLRRKDYEVYLQLFSKKYHEPVPEAANAGTWISCACAGLDLPGLH